MNLTIHTEEKRVARLQSELRRIDSEGWKYLEPHPRREWRLRLRLANALVVLARRLDPATRPADTPVAGHATHA